jgi:hypothetical protein
MRQPPGSLCFVHISSFSTTTSFRGHGPSQANLNAASGNPVGLLPNDDYAGQRFVDLKPITQENTTPAQAMCVYPGDDNLALQPNPLVYKGLMYITTAMSELRKIG